MRKADNLPPSCAVVTKSGNLNFLEPSGPIQVLNGTDLYINCNPSFKLIVLTIHHRYLTKTVLLKALSKRKMATTAPCSKQGVEGAVSFRLVGQLNDLFTSPSSVPTFSAFLSWSRDRRHERETKGKNRDGHLFPPCCIQQVLHSRDVSTS